jgi:hypothetical protein
VVRVVHRGAWLGCAQRSYARRQRVAIVFDGAVEEPEEHRRLLVGQIKPHGPWGQNTAIPKEHQDGRAEHAAECRAGQVGAGRQPIDLLHQEFLAALQIRVFGSQLVGGAKGEACGVFVGHDRGMLVEDG